MSVSGSVLVLKWLEILKPKKHSSTLFFRLFRFGKHYFVAPSWVDSSEECLSKIANQEILRSWFSSNWLEVGVKMFALFKAEIPRDVRHRSLPGPPFVMFVIIPRYFKTWTWPAFGDKSEYCLRHWWHRSTNKKQCGISLVVTRVWRNVTD